MGERGHVVARFVGADGDRVGDLGKIAVALGMQRLFDQIDAECRKGRGEFRIGRDVPCFVGIDDQARGGGRFAHGRYTLEIAFAGEFDFQKWACGSRSCGFAHLLRRVDR